MIPVTLRVAIADDASTVEGVLRESYGKLLANDYPADLLEACMPMMVRANPKLLACGTYFVAQTPGGEAVGVGGWTAAPPGAREHTPGRAHLRFIGVKASAARSGVASQIVERCIRETRLAGFVWLESNSTLTAVPFYRAFGFKDLAAVHADFGDGLRLPCIRMQLALDAG